MKRHKFTSPIGTNWDLSFWTPVNFEVEYFINEETEGVLTDTQTAKYGILDEISLVRDRSGWCGFDADYGILVRCGADLAWCGED